MPRSKKKMRDLLTAIEQKTNEAYAAMEAKDTAKAQALLCEAKNLRTDYETLEALDSSYQFFAEHTETTPADQSKAKEPKPSPSNEATQKFLNAFRNGLPKPQNLLSEGVDRDGGYTVPEEIVTQVERFRETQFSLLPYVSYKSVSTDTGSETVVKKSQNAGFMRVDEAGKFGAVAGPEFDRVSWSVKKYGGYIPVTQELLEDSDENIQAFIAEWLAKAGVATENRLILEALGAKEAVELDGIDGMKYAVNVTLGTAYAPYSRILTNDDGFNYLDTLKDSDGRYLLSKIDGEPFKKLLALGSTNIEVVKIPNFVMPSAKVYAEEDVEKTTPIAVRYPFIIGDTNEAAKVYDRKRLTIGASDTAIVGSGESQLNAFEEDLSITKGRMRLDVKPRDMDAIVNGYVEISLPAEKS